MKATSQLTISKVSQASGLSITTIRYYDSLGLLSPRVIRSKQDYDLFEQEILGRLDLIKRAQTLGLGLKDIEDVFGIHQEGKVTCETVKSMLLDKLAHLEQEKKALENHQKELQNLLSTWQNFPSVESNPEIICPNIQ